MNGCVFPFRVFYETKSSGGNEDVYEIGPFISKATDDCNMQNSKHYIPGLIRMKIRDPI